MEEDKFNFHLVVIGSSSAGKSTTTGHLMYLGGRIDPILLHQTELEALSLSSGLGSDPNPSRFSWVMAKLAKDRALHPPSFAPLTPYTHEAAIKSPRPKLEEFEEGGSDDWVPWKIETDGALVTIIDTPGHPNFFRNMVTGASQAHGAMLIVSAIPEELEASISLNGPAYDHLCLIRNLGIKHLLVAVNKMDQMNYQQDAFKQTKTKVIQTLLALGFDPSTISIVPISGAKGENLMHSSPKLQWHINQDGSTGPTLIQAIDGMASSHKNLNIFPLRVTIQDSFTIPEIGTVGVGMVVSGSLEVGQSVVLSPSNATGKIKFIERSNFRVTKALPGDRVGVHIPDVTFKQLRRGTVISQSGPYQLGPVLSFQAELIIFSTHGPISKAGLEVGIDFTLDCHNAYSKCQLTDILAKINPNNGQRSDPPNKLYSGDAALVRLTCDKPTALDLFATCSSLGRFALRSTNYTIAVGVIVSIES